MIMQRAYRVAGSLLLLLALFLAYEALKLTYFTSIGPGPGFFPFWLSVILAGLALAMVIRSFMGPEMPELSTLLPNLAGCLRMAAIVASLLFTAVLLEPLGFRLTMLAVFAFLLVALGRHRLAVTASVALAGSFGTYHVFVHWLNVPLPSGIFGL